MVFLGFRVASMQSRPFWRAWIPISQVLGHDARRRPSPNFQIQTLGSWPSCRLRGSVLPLHCPLLHTNNYEANLGNYSLVKKFRCYVTSLAACCGSNLSSAKSEAAIRGTSSRRLARLLGSLIVFLTLVALRPSAIE